MYAEVIIDISHEKVDKGFTYQVPLILEKDIQVGSSVLVPFGKGNTLRSGYVIALSNAIPSTDFALKSIHSLSGEVGVDAKLIVLAEWMKQTYGGTMIQALKTVLPVKKKVGAKQEKWLYLLIPYDEGKEKLSWYQKKRQTARARLLEALLAQEVLSYQEARKELAISMEVVTALEKEGIVEVRSHLAYRSPIEEETTTLVECTTHTKEQMEAITTFCHHLYDSPKKPFLLFGVTGSGKTEVYLEMIAKIVQEGKQAIFLIPEIALTYQTVRRFQSRFPGRVSILNSRMSDGERYDQIQRAKKGEVDVMIGPRSAIFTPFPRLGLIVIDEEHEGSYKSEQTPAYHARNTALKRCELEGAHLVLGSATPSLEAMYQVKQGEAILLTLSKRVFEQPLPTPVIVDMEQEYQKGNPSLLSVPLQEAIKKALSKGEQCMIFLNRRGYAGFTSCRSCGYVVKCPHCDVALSTHQNGTLQCHYCGFTCQQVSVCPSCGSPYVNGTKAGTQQIEALLKQLFPGVTTLRMDYDTTRKKEGYEKILTAFRQKEASILIGTQMIVKGHDFPEVTVVGILSTDMSLYASDFRAGERTFQLIVQAAGRAGRGDKGGEVFIQTYHPDHYAIVAGAKQDYEAFYEEEIAYRKFLCYPPVASLGAVLVAGQVEEQVEMGAEYIKKFITLLLKKNQKGVKSMGVTALGPAPPSVGKIKDAYRRVIYLKATKDAPILWIKDKVEEYIAINVGFQQLWVQFDLNPVNLF